MQVSDLAWLLIGYQGLPSHSPMHSVRVRVGGIWENLLTVKRARIVATKPILDAVLMEPMTTSKNCHLIVNTY